MINTKTASLNGSLIELRRFGWYGRKII